MNDELISIGDLARGSGLSLSAIRFYDAEGVLTPAWVDPSSGYRRYRRDQVVEARIIAGLRRVGMGVADIARVVSSVEPGAAQALLDRHLRRLELGLEDARRELSTLREVIHRRESPMNDDTIVTADVEAAQLVAALLAVRFAASGDAGHPVLDGVLIELDHTAGVCRAVATDRFRLAVSAAPLLTPLASGGSVVAPGAFIDEVLAAGLTGRVTVTVGSAEIAIGGLRAARLDGAFPDYRRLTERPHERRVAVDGTALAREVSGDAAPTALLAVVGERLGVVTEPADGVIAVDRGFLLEALGAHAGGELLLELDGPIAPLMIRDPQRPETFSMLMPIRL